MTDRDKIIAALLTETGTVVTSSDLDTPDEWVQFLPKNPAPDSNVIFIFDSTGTLKSISYTHGSSEGDLGHSVST